MSHGGESHGTASPRSYGAPVLGGRARRCRLLGVHAGGGRGRLPPRALRGVNHLDIAPSYGHAEVVVGPHVPAVRDRLFVAGKSERSDPDGVRAHLERTLERLGCDHLDLYQLHGVTSVDVLEQRSAAAEVILAARDEGLTRFVGITGHDLGTPRAQLEALRRYDLDTVMFPVYPRVWADPVYRADAEALLAECARRDAGVMAIKAVARRPWGEGEPTATTWYEPHTEPDAIARGIAFALSTPGSTRSARRATSACCHWSSTRRRPTPPSTSRPGTRPWRRRRSTRSSSRWRRRPAGTDGCAVPRRIAGVDRAAPSALTAGLRRSWPRPRRGPRCWPRPSAPG